MIQIKTEGCATGARAVIGNDGKLLATIHHEKPTRANGRAAMYNVCRISGRVDWFDTYAQARDDALKG